MLIIDRTAHSFGAIEGCTMDLAQLLALAREGEENPLVEGLHGLALLFVQ
jgi:hypothetical protein